MIRKSTKNNGNNTAVVNTTPMPKKKAQKCCGNIEWNDRTRFVVILNGMMVREHEEVIDCLRKN